MSKFGSEDGAGGFVTVMEPVSPMGRVKRVAIVSSAGLCYRDVDYRVGG